MCIRDSSLFGFIIGIWADNFEKLSLIPTLIITPLVFLGGSFYSIDMLPEIWQKISLFNPVLYLVSGFRWSFYEIADVNNLNLSLDVNGKRMQNGSPKTMVYGVNYLVSYLSHFMSLHPGDIISTGTPPGVGMGKKPQVFLKQGDVMKLGIEGLGEQTQKTISA